MRPRALRTGAAATLAGCKLSGATKNKPRQRRGLRIHMDEEAPVAAACSLNQASFFTLRT